MPNTAQTIESLLREKISPAHIEVVDESLDHLGHAGAAAGGGHFQVLIVAEAFRGQSAVERHRMVYDALRELMKQEIHALALRTLTPEEWK